MPVFDLLSMTTISALPESKWRFPQTLARLGESLFHPTWSHTLTTIISTGTRITVRPTM